MFDFASDPRPKIPLSDIIVSTNRGRKDFALVMELKTDIETYGLLQPIGVQASKELKGKWNLIFGETRFRACLLIPEMKGLIPYTESVNRSDLEMKQMELRENLIRKDISWMEQIQTMLQIEDLQRTLLGDKSKENPKGWSHKETAQLAGVSAGFISQQIGLAKTLNSRPDIKARVKDLPMPVAIRVTAQIQESERTERLAASGEIQLTSELQHCDALTLFRSLPPDSLDLVLTDPPFGMEDIESRRGEASSDFNKSSSYLGQLKAADNSTNTEVFKLLSEVLPEIHRTLKPGSHFYMFFDLEMLGELKQLVTKSGLLIAWPVLIWDKGRTTSIFRGSAYSSCFESILFGYKPIEQRRLQSPSAALLRFPAKHAVKKIHVFEKPLELLADLIKRSTNHGDLVCDPFAGSGSTLDAAKQVGRRAIGCELDREHYIKAQARLLESNLSTLPAEITK